MTEFVGLPRPVRSRFLWVLPAWFVIASLVGFSVPGHGGQLFFIGALPGVWACALFDGGALGLAPTLLGGVPILALLGWLLDRLRAGLGLWLFAVMLSTLIAGYLLMQGHADAEAAIARHGSLLAYAVCALQLGSYGATLIVLCIRAATGHGRDWE